MNDPRIDHLLSNPAFAAESDNDDEMVGTILTRREALAQAGKAGLCAVLSSTLAGLATTSTASPPQRGTRTISLLATPQVTEGPFFVDEKLFRSDLVSGSSRTSVTSGLPLILNLAVYKLVNNQFIPYPGLYFDVWHADAHGVYSDEPQGLNAENTQGQTFLRGYQITDSKGTVMFQTIWPGWYIGRTPHIHFKIRAYNASGNATSTFTSQFFFDDSTSDSIFQSSPYYVRNSNGVYNTNDNVYSARQADGTMVGSHLMLNISANPRGTGAVGTFAIGLT
ncbi:MAG: twin-arginine translocation pathway signal protein [Armatimonadetes bacterium]|nr:twin-arginine translocation pathway signal protein [Armatimonadota bacterium]